MLTQEYLKSIAVYDKDSGIFTRKVTRNRFKKGSIMGHKDKRGYVKINIDGREYKAHRLAWLYMNGETPEVIDHINHTTDDNRIVNLRDVTQLENCKNSFIRSHNSSGVSGVYFSKGESRWKASISVDRRRVNLGTFVEFSDAVNARKNAEVLYAYHENHGKTKEEIDND